MPPYIVNFFERFTRRPLALNPQGPARPVALGARASLASRLRGAALLMAMGTAALTSASPTRAAPAQAASGTTAAITSAARMPAVHLPPPYSAARPHPATAAPRTGGDLAWGSLTRQEQNSLAPLAQQWPTMDTPARERWLRVAQRLPRMPAANQARVQTRMRAWAAMPPQQRGQARLNYERAQALTPAQRKARWQAYQALSPQQKQALALKARQDRRRARVEEPAGGSRARAMAERATQRPGIAVARTGAAKAPPPGGAPGVQVVTPIVVRSRHGATTRLIGRKPHHIVHLKPANAGKAPAAVRPASGMPPTAPMHPPHLPAAGSGSAVHP